MKKPLKKALKITAITLTSLILVVVLTLGSYVIYLSATYYRIEDNTEVSIYNNKDAVLTLGNSYSVSTYNIGFGAYSHDFDFFMDSGIMKDGTSVSGSGSRAKDKTTVLQNTNGAAQVLNLLEKKPDFMLFQEVDLPSERSWKVDQFDLLQQNFKDEYSSNMALNFHSGFLFYPLFDPHGSVTAGIASFSKYKINSATRRSFPVDNGFFAKFFDLDRCFNVMRLPIDGTNKELVMINLHMSAYDEGGKIRAKQLDMLKEVISSEYAKGNYVIAGGDFNHDIADSLNTFETMQVVPKWVNQLTASDLPEGFSFAASKNAPTCRSTDMPYTKGVNYSVVIDGFIVSDNIEVVADSNIDTNFLYSDHNPVLMEFKLKNA